MLPLALTIGDPSGIGPEIAMLAFLRRQKSHVPPFLLIADPDQLKRRAQSLNMDIAMEPSSARAALDDFARGVLPILPLGNFQAEQPGIPTTANAAGTVEAIERAVDMVVKGELSALVTCPIAKKPLYDAGFKFPGHTEFLGELTAAAPFEGRRGPVMMLTAQDLRVTLVTVHEPLAKVSAKLTLDGIVHAGQVTAEALQRDFGVIAPRLAVAALNPHAGESGAIGREEIDIVAPAVQALRELGVDARGPYPADTLFPAEVRQTYDAALCLYHDQALIPVKMLDFWGGVNVTLGLPIVRTSPDHGTGFDIAGQGIARPDSLIAALRLADQIARRRETS